MPVFPHGNRLLPFYLKLSPFGKALPPNGCRRQPNGKPANPDGYTRKANGLGLFPQGSNELPNALRSRPSGKTAIPCGNHRPADAFRTITDGNPLFRYGSMVFPKSRRIFPKGSAPLKKISPWPQKQPRHPKVGRRAKRLRSAGVAGNEPQRRGVETQDFASLHPLTPSLSAPTTTSSPPRPAAASTVRCGHGNRTSAVRPCACSRWWYRHSSGSWMLPLP